MNEQATKPEARQPLEVENLLRLLEQPEVRARLLELLNEEYVPPEVKP